MNPANHNRQQAAAVSAHVVHTVHMAAERSAHRNRNLAASMKRCAKRWPIAVSILYDACTVEPLPLLLLVQPRQGSYYARYQYCFASSINFYVHVLCFPLLCKFFVVSSSSLLTSPQVSAWPSCRDSQTSSCHATPMPRVVSIRHSGSHHRVSPSWCAETCALHAGTTNMELKNEELRW
jgi:hypothetical protein